MTMIDSVLFSLKLKLLIWENIEMKRIRMEQNKILKQINYTHNRHYNYLFPGILQKSKK
jgi:hypothetical protein